MGSGRRITVEAKREPTIFPAAHDGFCNCCCEDFFEGDPIGYLDGEICCETCVLE